MFGSLSPRMKGGLNHHAVPIVVPLTSLLAVDDIAQVLMPGSSLTYIIAGISASCRVLTSGTATLVVKNAAGATITSIVLTAGGVVAGALALDTIAAGDKLRFGFSGVGVGLVDVTATVWIKMPPGA